MVAFDDFPQPGWPAPSLIDTAHMADILGPEAFARVAAYVEQLTGIRTPDSRRLMLETKLRRRRIAAGFPSLDAYLTHVFTAGGLAEESAALIDAATVNKTDFFREPRHFDILAQDVIPNLQRQGVRRIRAWSAACSTGPEPYSMAMVLADAARRTPDLDYVVLGTDICTHVLETARRAIFDAALVEPVPPDLRRRYVRVAVNGEPVVRISPKLRARTAFARMNLMEPLNPLGEPAHIIFCRNVLIYFDAATQAEVLSRLAAQLAPGGYLFVGHSESMAGAHLDLERIDHTVFRK
jgi:chemotaxis protein methyltransferase CheR